MSDGSTWTYRVSVAGAPVDICKIARPMTITHGRSTSATQPDAPQLDLTWLGPTAPGKVGDDITVTVDVSGSGPEWIYDAPDNYTYDDPMFVYDNAWLNSTVRFTGFIDSMTADEREGRIIQWAVAGIGVQARLALLQAKVSRSQETEIARVQAIAATHGTPISIRGTSTLVLVADAVDDGMVEAWQEVAASSGGLVWQSPDGTMNYGTGNHRHRVAVGVLPCNAVADGLSWSEGIEQILNHVTVKWGPEPQQEKTYTDSNSVTKWGQRHVDVTTLCAIVADADTIGALILGRRSQPFWLMPGVLSDATKADYPDKALLARLDVGDIILVPAESTPTPTPGLLTPWVVEGWIETAAANGHTEIQLALADAARWVQMRVRTWDEARLNTWGQEAAGSWLDALIVEVAA